MDKMQLAETDSGNASKHSVRDFAGGISFVGNLYEKNSYDELETRFPEYLRGYFDAVMEAQLNISGGNIIEPMLGDPVCRAGRGLHPAALVNL